MKAPVSVYGKIAHNWQ